MYSGASLIKVDLLIDISLIPLFVLAIGPGFDIDLMKLKRFLIKLIKMN